MDGLSLNQSSGCQDGTRGRGERRDSGQRQQRQQQGQKGRVVEGIGNGFHAVMVLRCVALCAVLCVAVLCWYGT